MGKYMSETAKNVRYDKIQEAIEAEVHRLADEYKFDNGEYREGERGIRKISEEKLDDEAYQYACEKILSIIDENFKNKEIYWIIDVMLQENFDNEPHPDNPYAIRKKNHSIDAELTPMGIMFNVK